MNLKEVDKMLIFIMLLLLTSCSHKYDYIGTVNTIVSRETKKIRKEEGLELFGYGGAMCDGIKSITITFASYQTVDLAEARRMIVRQIERLRNAVNAKEDLKEHLIPYPFPINGMEVSILFLQKSGKFIEYGCVWLGTGGVSHVSQIKDELFYSSYNPRTKLLEDYFNETYEEALAIVNAEMNNELYNECTK